MPSWTEPTPAQAPAPQPVSDPVPQRAFDSLDKALGELLRTAECVRLYDHEHPAVAAGRESAAEAFNGALAVRSPMTVAVHHDALQLDGKPLPTPARLASALYRAEIATVRFSGKTTPEACEALAIALGGALSGTADPSALMESVTEASAGFVLLRPIDYRALGAGAGGTKRDTGEGGLDVAERLASAIATASCGSIADAAHMASGLERRFEEIGPEEAERIREAAAAAAGSDGADSLRAFFAAMSPEARAKLMDFGGAPSGPDLAQLADVSLLLPVADVVSAIDALDIKQASAAPATVKLFRRLAAIAPGADDQTERIAKLAERWKNTTEEDDADTLSGLTELLTTLSDESFNPTEYEQRLSELIECNQTFVDLASSSDIDDDEAMRMRALEISSQVLGAELPETIERHNPLSGIESSIPMLIEEGRLDLLAEAVTQAQRISLRPVGDKEAEAASALVKALSAQDVLRLAANRFAAGGAQAGDAERLLRASGAASLEAIIAAAERVTGASRRLAQLARGIDASQFERRLGAIAALDPGRMVGLQRLVEDMPSNRIAAMLEPARRAQNPTFRVHAYRALSVNLAQWSTSMLFDALADPVDAVRRCAIEHLADRHDKNAAEMLSRLLAGGLPGPKPNAEIVERVIIVLETMHEDVAVNALSEALLALRSTMIGASGQTAYRIAKSLATYQGHPEALAALASWTRSPSRLSGLLLGRGTLRVKGAAA